MRLINVKAFLEVENMFERCQKPEAIVPEVLQEFEGSKLTKAEYAILSHCWHLKYDEEVHFKDMKKLVTMEESKRNAIRGRTGYQKLLRTCEQADKDDLHWVWADTCCINKQSSSELSEAINSMYNWYTNSQLCYAYLHDMDCAELPSKPDEEKYSHSNGWPKWFSRGWALQELIAPKIVHLFNHNWEYVGEKRDLAHSLTKITRIPSDILKDGFSPYRRPCAAQIMSWAAHRKTKREEDRAYSLLGLLGVNMPMLYGEGKKAFQRLQLELIRTSNDHSIFAWGYRGMPRGLSSVLADDPSHFQDCDNLVRMDPDEFIDVLRKDVSEDELSQMRGKRLQAFTATNAGISIWLPATPYHDSPSVFRVTLACRRNVYGSRKRDPVTIHLALWKSVCYRYFGRPGTPKRITEFQKLLLAHQYEVGPDLAFRIDDRAISYHGFSSCNILPREMANNSFTLTSTNPVAISTYVNEDSGVRFVVVFGYCFGQEWVHVIWSEEVGEVVCDRAWMEALDQARRIAEARASDPSSTHRIKHIHIPRSINAVQVTCSRREFPGANECKVTLDIVHCTGCCPGPLTWRSFDAFQCDDDTPGLFINAMVSTNRHWLTVGDHRAMFLFAPGIALGDYGCVDPHVRGGFRKEGNIFLDFRLRTAKPGIDSPTSVCRFAETMINGAGYGNDYVITQAQTGPGLVLHEPVRVALPNNEQMVSFLKALSWQLSGKCLVTSVVRCSSYHATMKEMVTEYCDTSESSLTSDSHDYSAEPQTFTPLYTLATPHAWHPDQHDTETRELCSEIREQFDILLDSRRPLSHESIHVLYEESGAEKNRIKTRESAIKFFTEIFGLDHLKDYVGGVTFERLTPALAYTTSMEPDAGLCEDGMKMPCTFCTSDNNLTTQYPNYNVVLGEMSKMTREPSIGVLAKTLMEKIPSDADGFRDRRRWVSALRKIVRQAESIARCLGNVFLDDIIAAYSRPADLMLLSKTQQPNNSDSRHDVIRTMMEEIQTYKEKLYVAKDDSEYRALEEDITGKILLVCWNGIRSEIQEVPEKVVDYIAKSVPTSGTPRNALPRARTKHLENIRRILKDALTEVPDDGQIRLRRILADARAGVSKYELLLTARNAREVVRSTTPASKGGCEADLQEPASSTTTTASPTVPRTSGALEAMGVPLTRPCTPSITDMSGGPGIQETPSLDKGSPIMSAELSLEMRARSLMNPPYITMPGAWEMAALHSATA